MRTYDIPYVRRGPGIYYPPVKLENMSLDEIKKKYIKTCAKANGSLNECKRCLSQCNEGKRALELMSENNIPLYDGMTLLEKAREENAKRKEEVQGKKGKDGRLFIENWYEKAVASGDPVDWVMKTYGINRLKAKQKIYAWKTRHVIKDEPKVDNKNAEEVSSIESKLEALMKEQEKYKQTMIQYQSLYEGEKQKYDEVTKKIDVLCNAMDILSN